LWSEEVRIKNEEFSLLLKEALVRRGFFLTGEFVSW
jgi:hypothetical protein